MNFQSPMPKYIAQARRKDENGDLLSIFFKRLTYSKNIIGGTRKGGI